MKERWRNGDFGESGALSVVTSSFFPACRKLLPQVRSGSAALAGGAARDDGLDRRYHPLASAAAALVVEQGGEVVTLEGVDERDDLVLAEVVVVVDRRVAVPAYM